MPTILLIDDDLTLLDVLSLAIEDDGHTVLTANNGNDGLARIAADQPDAVVCDVNMPGLDGFLLCQRLRSSGNLVPLVLLTSRDNDIDEAMGLEFGADDYVAKPFSTRVLLARIRGLLRRQSAPPALPLTPHGGLHLDAERLTAPFNSELLTTPVTEFRLLQALTSRPGVVFSRDRLLTLARGDDSVVAIRSVDTYVRRLRRLLEAVDPEFDALETVVGAGYRWRAS
jgi:DNA-binding response OmpR family regulator